MLELADTDIEIGTEYYQEGSIKLSISHGVRHLEAEAFQSHGKVHDRIYRNDCYHDPFSGRSCLQELLSSTLMIGHTLPDHYGPVSSIPALHNVVPDTKSELGTDLASSWPEKCRKDHLRCGNGESYMPHRLLYLGQAEQDECQVLLIENPPVATPYAALSYCWGYDLGGVVKTLKSNIAAHREGIPLDALLKTTQDAVLVCCGLNLRCL